MKKIRYQIQEEKMLFLKNGFFYLITINWFYRIKGIATTVERR